ncbi:Abi family protein [Bifidobacterium leontopitheci]|uniref:DNA-binding protein n=1 Tax=Bifidobacterium leontopitheci TaxID=2650774 RepID=A0A6I1GET2_9BIFI|nr:Abi family protein [Bifidobacterium leontopitheci]KAB7790055.1 DNA-binding protein [Bifidobacterium leontopitheci]
MSRQSNPAPAFLSQAPRKGSPQERALRACITDERLASYDSEARRRSCPALRLYLWDHDMASACMGDIAILEVALRNHMDQQLSLISLEQSGTEDWYMAGLRFDDRTQRQIREAWGHLTVQQKKRHTHGHLVAALTFGFWRNLLENGGAIHAHWPDEGSADYENDLWRKGIVKAFPGGRRHASAANAKWTRNYALNIVKTVHALRNRVAHHEPLVNGIPLPGENRRITLADAVQSCFGLAMILDRDLYAWLMDNSKMKLVLEHEPQPNE